MTTKTKKVAAKKPQTMVKVEQPASPINNFLIGATEPVLKALAMKASTDMLKQPQFAFQANQTGLLELADLIFKYMTNQVTVQHNQPETPAQPETTSPTFG